MHFDLKLSQPKARERVRRSAAIRLSREGRKQRIELLTIGSDALRLRHAQLLIVNTARDKDRVDPIAARAEHVVM